MMMNKAYPIETVDYNQLTESVRDALSAAGCVDANRNVMRQVLPSGAHVYLKRSLEKDDPRFYPAVVVMYGKLPYIVEGRPTRQQDGSDLDFYSEVIVMARARQERDDQTCEVIECLHDFFIIQLAVKTYANMGSDATIRSRRGRIQLAKYTACRLWRAGNKRSK
jgi:hypothetical protein